MTHVAPCAEILAQCEPSAERVAIVSDDRQLTYRQLEQQSAKLAHALLEAGARPGDVIGTCLTARPEHLVAMLAIFRVGGVHLPLDPTHPPALIAYELEEAKPRTVIHERVTGKHLTALGHRLLDVDAWATTLPPPVAGSNVPVDVDSLALILFTSGTTGRPKGVKVTHRNLSQLVRSARAAYGFRSSDVFCSIARYTFSICNFELLSPLSVGGTLHLSRREDVLDPKFLAALLRKVTVLHAGPSLLSRLAQVTPKGESFPGVRHVSTGGDIVLPAVMEQMKELFPQAELFVIYGCTEICCTGTEYAIPREEKCTKPYVGRPFAGMGVLLVDEALRPTSDGEVGEICFAGYGVVPGYVNRPEIDAEKFVDIEGTRYYRTGDLGRRDAAGDLEFLGRNDFQVQIRGIRVELLGVENTIRELKLADHCAAVLRHFGEGDDRLVAFVQGPRASNLEMRKLLAQRFPDYMVPSLFVPVTALPSTLNGKLDRRALESLPIAGPAGAGTR